MIEIAYYHCGIGYILGESFDWTTLEPTKHLLLNGNVTYFKKKDLLIAWWDAVRILKCEDLTTTAIVTLSDAQYAIRAFDLFKSVLTYAKQNFSYEKDAKSFETLVDSTLRIYANRNPKNCVKVEVQNLDNNQSNEV